MACFSLISIVVAIVASILPTPCFALLEQPLPTIRNHDYVKYASFHWKLI